MAASTHVTHKERYLQQKLVNQISMANRLLLEDIHRESQPSTPFKGGDLREQVDKRVDGLEGTITWKVPYASYQERGKRYDGSHVVRHYTTPGTGKNFAKKAVRKVVTPEHISKYIGFGKFTVRKGSR